MSTFFQRVTLLFTTLFISLGICFSIAQTTLIQSVNVVDVENGRILSPRNILIEDDRISRITTENITEISDSLILVDGTDKYVMPGMIDAHIHFFQTGGLYTRPDAIDLRSEKTYAEELEFAASIIPDNFRRYLRLGITTIADVGGPFFNFQIRDSLAKKYLSPNVLVTGPLFSSYQPDALTTDDPPIIKVNNTQEIDTLFDRMLPYKPDFIKVWYIVSPNIAAEETLPLIEYINQRAEEHNLKLCVHATQLETAKLAIRAGADILVHSIETAIIPEELIAEMKAKEVTYIPTLIVGGNYGKTFLSRLDLHPQDLKWANPEAYGSLFDLKALTEEELPAGIKNIRKNADNYLTFVKRRDSIMAINLVRLFEGGVNVATGTDAGNIGTLHASSYLQEQELMQQAGLTIAQILKASTINPARGFGKEKLLGTVAEGKLADLVVLSKNPLDDLSHLSAIDYVFKSGQLLEAEQLVQETPEMVVQRQVNAYNARDIDAFMDTYTEGIEIYNFPDQLVAKGKTEMRKNYARMFENVPNLYCEIKNRIVLGTKIIDEEYVRFNESYLQAVAIYEVENGKIAKVTFVK